MPRIASKAPQATNMFRTTSADLFIADNKVNLVISIVCVVVTSEIELFKFLLALSCLKISMLLLFLLLQVKCRVLPCFDEL